MASSKATLTCLFLVTVVAFLCAGTTTTVAQSDCNNVIVSMASCLNYVTGTSATPSPQCCSSLANVVRSQPRCLCTVLNGGGSSMGISINTTLALALPATCKVQTPPVSECEGVSGSGTTPVGSPEGAPAPVAGNANDDGNKMKLQLVGFGLVLAASYAFSFRSFSTMMH